MSAENHSKAKLLELKDQGFNRVPLVREVLADLDTPLVKKSSKFPATESRSTKMIH